MAGKIRKLGNFFSGFLLSGYLDSGLEKKQMGPLVVASDKIDFIVQKEICLGHIAEVTLWLRRLFLTSLASLASLLWSGAKYKLAVDATGTCR